MILFLSKVSLFNSAYTTNPGVLRNDCSTNARFFAQTGLLIYYYPAGNYMFKVNNRNNRT